MKTEWYTPKEKLPPLNKPVMLNMKFPYVGELHAYGWFGENGWETLSSHIKTFVVEKWSYFIPGKEIK